MRTEKLKTMKSYITWYSLLITVAFAILLFIINCEGETSTVQVTTPEVKGTLPTNRGTAIVQKPIYFPSGKTGIPKNPKNSDISENSDSLSSMLQVYKDELDFAVDRYNHETDSLKKLLMFKNVIALKSFKSNFEDKYLKLELNGYTANGEVKEITPTYTIKPQKVDVKIPELKFRLLAGGGFGVNRDFNQVLYKANIGWQKKSGNVYRVAYLNVNGQSYGMFETDLSIFKIEK